MRLNATNVVIVAAVADNGVIGGDNALPWRLPSDLKHFRAITMDRPVIMGRKTFQSIGRPLPGRTNIVVTRNPRFMPPGIIPALSFEAAIDVAHADADHRGTNEIAVIGGGQVYAAAITMADRLEITEVQASPKGDAVFPDIDAALWAETKRVRATPTSEDDHQFSFVTYGRRD